MDPRFAFLFAGVAAIACGSGGSSSGGVGQPGCTIAPECSACGDCYSLCVCTTGDHTQCYPACGINPAGTGGASAGGGAPGGGGAPAGGTSGGGGTTNTDLASGVSITEVSVYQGVKVPIMQNGGEVTSRNAPVIAGRPALVRVFVSPDANFQAREIIARISLGTSAFEAKGFISGLSQEANLQTTLNIEVPGEQLTPGLGYAVTLLEGAPGAPAGPEGGARFPQQGEVALGATSVGNAFNVVVVPMVVNGYTPDTSPARLETLKNRLFGLFPAPAVNISATPPVNYPGSISPTSGGGWSNALDFLLNYRQSQNPPKNTYYYGMVTPASSMQNFCGGGCIAGLSGLASANDVWARGSIGLGYFPSGGSGGSSGPPDTMAHELGHAQGLPHAPCQTQDAGPFPYPGGGIGVYGYDLVTKALFNPGTYKDVMGYCNPSWISDFNFKKLSDRIGYVNSTAYVLSKDPDRAPGKYQSVIVSDDGLEWGLVHELDTSPMGEKKTIQVLDDAGKVVNTVTGLYYDLHHIHGGILLVPVAKVLPGAGARVIAPAGLGKLALPATWH